MSTASKYQERSVSLKNIGTEYIREIQPHSGDVVLDFGCGTGELSAFLADLVGPDGRVVGVDPDAERIRLARETHASHSNLTFEIGSSYGFPGDGEQMYDLVFSNIVLHWVHNKQELFGKVFSSLKKGGRAAMLYMQHWSIPLEKFMKEVGLQEQFKSLINEMMKFEANDVVKAYLEKEGMKVLCMNSKEHRPCYNSAHEFYDFYVASTSGLIDMRSVTKQRINKVAPLFIENGKFEDFYVTVDFIAKKE